LQCSGTRPTCRTCQIRSLQCDYSADADANPIIALKRKHTALNEAYNAQRREIALLQSRAGQGITNDFPETHVQGTGQVPITPAPGSDLDNNRLSVAIRSAHRNESPVHHRFSQRREVNHKSQAVDILHALTFTSDQDSIILLSRLRLGESWTTVAGSLPAYQSPSAGGTQRIDTYSRHGALPTLTQSGELPDELGAESPADQFLAEQFMPSLPEAASTPLKPWLVKAFDRDYFRQVCHMYYTSRSQMLPTGSGNQSSFGNMPFSSAIYANHHPEHVQETQQRNFHAPIWAQRVLHATMMQVDPFHDIVTELRSHIAGGMTVEDVCGPHAYLAALDDADTFHRAPMLSQFVARTVISLKPSESRKTTFTQYAVMYKYWSYWRWLLNPTKENYFEIPEFVKPTAPLLFVAHPALFDLVMPPALRDLMVQHDNPSVEWFTEAAITITCHWEGGGQAALLRDGFTDEFDFNPICKVSESVLFHIPTFPKEYTHSQYTTVTRQVTGQLDHGKVSEIIHAKVIRSSG
jgi:hypothetical protein